MPQSVMIVRESENSGPHWWRMSPARNNVGWLWGFLCRKGKSLCQECGQSRPDPWRLSRSANAGLGFRSKVREDLPEPPKTSEAWVSVSVHRERAKILKHSL